MSAAANGGPTATELVAELREIVSDLHAELPRNGLVAWTSGNVSARIPGADLMVIKPSGIGYDDLTPESMVLCDLDGNTVSDGYSPSSDTASDRRRTRPRQALPISEVILQSRKKSHTTNGTPALEELGREELGWA